MELFAVTNYQEFYGRPAPQDPFALLYNYPTDGILFFLCKANAALFQINQETIEGRIAVLTNVFPRLSREKKEKILAWLLGKDAPGGSSYRILFSKPSLSWLIGKCFRHYKAMDENDESVVSEVEEAIFDSILIANGVYYSDTGRYAVATYEHSWELVLRQQNYVRDVMGMVQHGAVKMLFFQKFIREHFSNGQELLDEFTHALGLKKFIDYSMVYMNILSCVFTGYANDGKLRMHIDVADDARVLIETFALHPDTVASGNGIESLHGHLMPKPVYYLDNQYPVVLDFNFLPFLIEKGLPYNFYQHSSLKKSPGFTRFVDFKGMLGKEFYEQYIAARIIARLFPHAVIFEGNKINELTDLMIIQGTDIYLFEIKSAALHYSVLEQIDVPVFKQFLHENFLDSKEQGKKNRGVHQLSRCISELHGETFSSIVKQGKKYNVYPVIVYMDSALDIHGVNAYCNETFNSSVDNLRSRFRHIYPLTMVSLNFFIGHYSRLRGKPGMIKELQRSYHKRVSSLNQSFRKSGEPFIFLSAGISFEYFIAEKHKEKGESVRQIADEFGLH
jgi:hypothetical protein